MVATTLGLSLLWPYCRGFYLEFLTTTIEHPGVASQAGFAAYSVAFALCALLVACAGPRIAPLLEKPRALPVLGIAGALGHLAIWLPAPFPTSLALCIAGAALMAICFVALLLRYAEALAADSPRRAALVCFASFGLCFLNNAVFEVPVALQAAWCVLAPVIAAACVPSLPRPEGVAAQSEAQGSPASAGPGTAAGERALPPRVLVALMVLLALFCLTGNFVRGVTNPWFSYEGPTNRAVLMSAINIAIVAASMVPLLRRRDTDRVLFWNWAAYMLLFFAGLLMLAFPSAQVVALGSDFATVSRVGFTLLMLLFSLGAARWSGEAPHRLVGLFLFVPEAISAIVRYIVVPLVLHRSGVEVSAFISYAGIGIIFVLIVAILAFLANLLLGQLGTVGGAAVPGASKAGAKPAGSPAEPSECEGPAATGLTDAEALERVARDYRLTARETQAASYISKGYSLEKTAELLGVSINTVRTHTRSVYAKLGVHARQELIDLLDDVKESASGSR